MSEKNEIQLSDTESLTILNEVKSKLDKPDEQSFLETEDAKSIFKGFQPILIEMQSVSQEHKEIMAAVEKTGYTKKNTEQAKEVLKNVKAIKTAINKNHSKLKRFYLVGGRLVDSLKNVQLEVIADKIEDLIGVVEYEKRKREAEQERIRNARSEAIKPFIDEVPDGIEAMSEDVWLLFYNGAKQAYENRLQSEKEAEERQKIEAAKLEVKLKEAEEAESKIKAAEAKQKEAEEKVKAAQEQVAREREDAARKQAEAQERVRKLEEEAKVVVDLKSFSEEAINEGGAAERMMNYIDALRAVPRPKIDGRNKKVAAVQNALYQDLKLAISSAENGLSNILK